MKAFLVKHFKHGKKLTIQKLRQWGSPDIWRRMESVTSTLVARCWCAAIHIGGDTGLVRLSVCPSVRPSVCPVWVSNSKATRKPS